MKPSCSSSADDQDVDGLLRRDLRERARNMAAHPDVLLRIPQKERERVDDRFAVGDQRGPGAALEPPVPQERHQRGDEDEVATLGPAAWTLSMASSATSGAGSYKQRDEQTLEPRIGDLADGDRDVAGALPWPNRWCRRRDRRSAASALSTSSRRELSARRPPPSRGCADRGRLSSGRANDAASSWLIAASAPIAAARTPESRSPSMRRMCGDPLLRDVAAHGAERRQRATPDHR